MRNIILIIAALLVSAQTMAIPEVLQRAREKGATATFRLTVVDDLGFPVDNVYGGGNFWDPYKNKTVNKYSFSDEKGALLISGRSFYDGSFYLKKEGYYMTKKRHTFSRGLDETAVNETRFSRRWVPDYASTEILKAKRNPIPMWAKQYRGQLPAVNQPLGFDLKQVDWVRPYGKGKTADVMVTVVAKEILDGKRPSKAVAEVIFEWPGKYNGVQVCNSDNWSEFISDYCVNISEEFQDKLVMPHPKSRYDWLDSRKHLVFRVRSEVSPTGELLRCHYGKIYPTFDITSEEFALRAVFFNPTPNDTNLEFDPQKNLSPFSCFKEEQMLIRGTP